MKFKKLKISVAVALVIFILITANIISFSFLQNKGTQSNLATPVDIRKSSSVSQTTSTPDQAPISQSSQSSQTTDTSSSQATSTVENNPQPTVISHTTTRTRAS